MQMKNLDFATGLKSFMGYLEGTQKSLNTIKSYRLDLLSFEAFLREEQVAKPKTLDLAALSSKDIDRFHQSMMSEGLRANTRRRKLLTVHRFFGYLAGRKKVPDAMSKPIPTPSKIERVPFTVELETLLQAIQELPQETELDARNRVLLWTLAESGCLVSEVTHLKYDQFDVKGTLEVFGKSPRKLAVSRALVQAVFNLRERTKKREPWLFLGFNKFGSMGNPITPRGVELLVKQYSPKLYPNANTLLRPKTFRQSAVLKWFREGYTEKQIQEFLGLKTVYAFKAYASLKLAKSDPAKSNL